MDIKELFCLIEKYFGYKANMLYLNSDIQEVGLILFNSFLVKCSLDERYNSFGAGITFGNQESTITEFLGKKCSLNSDEESIIESLSIIEKYCRLRLPDKFLRAFEEAYNSN